MLTFCNDTVDEIEEKFLDTGLVVARNSSTDLYQLAERLGKPFRYRKEKNVQYFADALGYVLRISNVDGILGDNELDWHQDHSHKPGIWYGTILKGIKNSNKSDTLFSDLELAYNDLPENVKTQINDISMIQSSSVKYESLDKFNSEVCHLDKADYRLATKKIQKQIVVIHPIRKTKILFLSPMFASISDDHKEIFEYLVNHASHPRYIQNFSWNDNDLLVFDNIKYMHKRFKFEGERLLYRTLFTFK
jgi:alpha-ketoglutarate-dependent taurine dioxygenase